MDTLLHDLRYALRQLRRSPGFTLVAALTLALGIGANSAIFSVIAGVLLRPLPYAEPGRLVRIYDENREQGVNNGSFSPQDFDDLATGTRGVYASVASYFHVPAMTRMSLVGQGRPEQLSPAYVSADFFRTLGVPARLGRTLLPAENVPGSDRVVVLSSGLWRTRFGGDPSVIGRKIVLDGQPFTVVGVMPPTFSFPGSDVQLWAPLSLIGDDDVPHMRGLRWLSVVGRLSPGVTQSSALAATDQLLRRLAEAYPESNEGWETARVTSLHDALVGDVRPALLVLMGVVALVLLIACANLANLSLARAAGRSRELALRSALGAGRGRLVRQILTESVLLALVGGVLGFVVAAWGVRVLLALAGDTIPRADAIRPDATVVAFTLAVSVLTGVLFGLVPALRASRGGAAASLKEGGRGGSEGRERQRTRGVLVVAEVALAVVLLAGAGLMARSFWRLSHVDPGFRADHVLRLRIAIPDRPGLTQTAQMAWIANYREAVLRRIAEVPGVAAVGAAKTVPLEGGGEPYAFTIPGRSGDVQPRAGVFIVTPGYFEALGIPLVRGREFDRTDGDDHPAVVISQALARQFWPDTDPVGQFIQMGESSKLEIVGVAGDVHNEGLAADAPATFYIPMSLAPRSNVNVFVRTTADPLGMAAAVRDAIWQVDPNQAVSDIGTMQEVVSGTIAQPRFFALLVSLFGTLALVLAAVGVFGVVSYTVRQRTKEFGIRMAVGATGRDVLALVLRRALALTAIGAGVGVAGALVLSRFLASQLYGVRPTDAATFAAAVLVLGGASLLASLIPARRATRVDPIETLRAE